MDEIGRGTSTFDGLSLAWASAASLASDVKAFTLFATHYFELTLLPDHIPGIVNVHLDATEYEDGIVFLHKVNEGPANQSYGLQVAQLAGVPSHVIKQAKQKLYELENHAVINVKPSDIKQPDLFVQQSPVLENLEAIHPDELTPRQALEIIYQLKKLLAK